MPVGRNSNQKVYPKAMSNFKALNLTTSLAEFYIPLYLKTALSLSREYKYNSLWQLNLPMDFFLFTDPMKVI